MSQPHENFWVEGGIYKSTSFVELMEGHALEQYGPFDSYAQAHVKWAEMAWKTVDDCHARYHIVRK